MRKGEKRESRLGSRQLGAIILIVTLSFSALASLQGPPNKGSKGKTHVILEHADELRYDRLYNPDVQRLLGNVVIKHEGAVMRCDSAHLNQEENTFEAFGQVSMQQGDTVSMFARYLHYDGNIKYARLRHEVRLENRSATLFTDSLDYDRVMNLGYYFEGGSIVDSLNTLTSSYGEYSPTTSDAIFRDNVHLENKDYTMDTEELHYNTDTKISHILGPTEMRSDSGYIVSTRGVYDSNTDVGILLDRSIVYSSNGAKQLTGDSIFYDRRTGFGEAFGNMILTDTVNRSSLYGEYGYYDEKKDYAFATQRSYMIDFSKPDTLWAAADTLEMITQRRVPEDRRIARGYRHVRVYRTDVQAIADSMQYDSRDSLLYLYDNPIMWNEDSQLSGDTIRFKFRNDSLDYVDVLTKALAVRRIDSVMYDQLAGRHIRAYMQDSLVRQIQVHGNAEVIQYEQHKRSKRWYLMNRIEAPSIIADFEEGQLKKVLLRGVASGKGYPIKMLTPDLQRLASFRWEEAVRPKSKEDLFRRQPDSVLQVHRSLSDLRRFSGALAALRAYTALAEEERKDSLAIAALQTDSIPPTPAAGKEVTDPTDRLSPYIARPTTDTKEEDFFDLFFTPLIFNREKLWD
ncbi:OstA-like protein [Porphyromonas gingivalis]|uniref:OstA-like protein n=1 Tax=Porphyromonas gingivalis TaxID=837 RepID=UPI000974F6CD|nr:OstA-like protein [Porphyromonas gingivalis]SJL31280.1 hypothetical protein PGIN_AFR-5B1_01070 [Porphyromonas gingivalis]